MSDQVETNTIAHFSAAKYGSINSALPFSLSGKMMGHFQSYQYGAADGHLLIYFHGVPGAPEEIAYLDDFGKTHGLTLFSFERFAVDAALEGDAYFQYLAKAILNKSAGKKVEMIGFSIGAFIALQTFRHMPHDTVTELHLISAAAPLEAGHFLDKMAGGPIFKLAQVSPLLLRLVTYGQQLLARFFPHALFRLVFASSVGADKTLVANPTFQIHLINSLQSCFVEHVPGYLRDIREYVHPWQQSLQDININTCLWQGEADNWSPMAMAEYLHSALPNCTQFNKIEGLSHNTCLYDALPKICAQLLNRT